MLNLFQMMFFRRCDPLLPQKNFLKFIFRGMTPCHGLSSPVYLDREILPLNLKKIDWRGKTWRIGQLIGQGVDGIVCELRTKDCLIEPNFVVKILANLDPTKLQSLTNTEIQLARELPGTYTPTVLIQNTMGSEESDPSIYISIFIKERVNGLTASEVMVIPMSLQEKMLIYRGFLRFKKLLKDQVQRIALERDIFIWDFHENNVMYDFEKKLWFLIDAGRESSYESLMAKFRSLVTEPSNHNHRVHEIYQLFQKEWQRIDTDEFFQIYIDLYFQEIENSLLAENQVSSIS